MSHSQKHTQCITLRISIENLAPQQGGILAPLWFGFHDGTFETYRLGQPASAALQRLAEDGNTGALANQFLGAERGLIQGTLFGSDDIFNSLFPGHVAQTILQIAPNAACRYFSYAAMIVPSNDAFIGNASPTVHEVFDASGAFLGADIIVHGSAVLDAGTEVNDEAALHAVGAGPIFIADAGVAENGVVHEHPGYQAGGTLLSNPAFANADFKAPGYKVARIRIEQK